MKLSPKQAKPGRGCAGVTVPLPHSQEALVPPLALKQTNNKQTSPTMNKEFNKELSSYYPAIPLLGTDLTYANVHTSTAHRSWKVLTTQQTTCIKWGITQPLSRPIYYNTGEH